jgi:hypothetical protein
MAEYPDVRDNYYNYDPLGDVDTLQEATEMYEAHLGNSLVEHCDHCSVPLHRDTNGWWVGPDESSDCPSCNRGHELDGLPS